MLEAAAADKAHSAERTYNLQDLRAVAVDVPAIDTANPHPSATTGGIELQSPRGRAPLTHWAFGQLARTVGAPASYLRDLPPDLAANCLNFGLQDAAPGTSANLLVRGANGAPPMIRACTSESYGRVFDADLYGAIARTIADRDASWSLPPTWTGEPAGAYRGDRDSFLILTNGGSIVTDPTLRNGSVRQTSTDGSTDAGAMFRGLLVRNSEVGASSIVIETILYRYICGNHMLWGAVIDKAFRRRHVGSNVTRDTMREIGRIAYQWTHAAAGRDEAIIKLLIDHEIAHTQEAVIDELRALGCTAEQAGQAYARCEQTEAVSPRSFWGAAQGLTRLSQDSQYQDDRYQLDKLAGLVLARGAKLVAA